MKEIKFEILLQNLLNDYVQQVDPVVSKNFESLTDSELSADAFSFYTSVSAVFSSKIEGEDIELDSFIKHKKWEVKFLPDHTRKIDDLYDAYQFAKIIPLDSVAINEAHILLTKNILQKAQRAKLRTGNMFVTTPDGKIEYVACTPSEVKGEMDKLYHDISALLSAKLKFEETLFFASMIHLIFVKIHPFNDGNGRTARLLEKWFMAQKLGPKAWFVQSEKYYYEHHQTYYKNIRKMGLEYERLDYSQAMPFLLMLPGSLQ